VYLTLEIFLAGAALLVFVPCTVLFVEILFATTRRTDSINCNVERHRLAVVMPAHNEDSVIAETLKSIVPQLRSDDRLLVVADNCTDNTATIAIDAHVEVIVRSNLTRRGKGFALDFGIRHLETDPPDIVIIVDADCQVESGSIDRLARVCTQTSRPVQALYLMHAGPHAALKMRIADFASTVKNLVRPLGLQSLGLPCQLMGTGMAFPWNCIQSAALATGHIAEDMKLGLDLARAGTPPVFCPEAMVTSEFPTSARSVFNQRTRWEHGHLSIIMSDAPPMLLESIKRMNLAMFALVLDLTVPPLALLTIMVVTLCCVSAGVYAIFGMWVPLLVATISGALLALSVLLSWARFGRQLISLGSLALGAVYPLWKIPIYARFLVARQLDWVKSKRGDD